MKHIQIFSLLFVLLFLTATLADEERDESLREDKEKQARELAQEALAGVCGSITIGKRPREHTSSLRLSLMGFRFNVIVL